MKHRNTAGLTLIAWLGLVTVTNAVYAQDACVALKSLELPNVTFTLAEAITPPWDVPQQTGFLATTAGLKVNVPFCRVVGYSAPTSDSRIGFEVWLPVAANWNGRFLASGNPGFIGSIALGGLANIVQRGYVAASTDTGHVDEGFQWAIGHPEKWVDWGHRAVHETAVVTKRLALAYYGRPIQYSYWNSCHNGGNQGLNEAQRYPDDFNGIVAGDPAFYISRLQSGSMYISWVSLKDGQEGPGYIPPAKYAVLNRAALDQCDALDGLTDGIIDYPPACKFDPGSIQCHGPDTASCLTEPQVETARKIYAGAKFKDGTRIYHGFEAGSELGWNLMSAGPNPFSVNHNYFRGLVFEDPNWDFRTFDVDRDTRLAEQKTGAAVDTYNPDLKPFRDSGGKLIMYQSWYETGIPPRTLVEYYGKVEQAMGGADQTRDFARLFMVPATSGCPGFRNAEDFNALSAIQRWVEEGKAPDQINYSHRVQDQVHWTRPVCAYPKVARYTGSGDPKAPENFSCVIPSE